MAAISINVDDELFRKLLHRSESTHQGDMLRTIIEDLSAFYRFSVRAERTVRNILTPEQIDACRAALSGSFIEPGIIPFLLTEIEGGMEEPDRILLGKLRQLGLMELYALGQIINRKGGQD